jgi:hypothetical protein
MSGLVSQNDMKPHVTARKPVNKVQPLLGTVRAHSVTITAIRFACFRKYDILLIPLG